MEDVNRSWGPAFYEDRLDPAVDSGEIHRLVELGLDFPFHVVEEE